MSEYILEGSRVIHNNVVILLHRTMRFSSPSHDRDQNPSTPDQARASTTLGPQRHLPRHNSLIPLDQSGMYTLQASIRVQDGSKPESMTLAINELKALKDMMKGVVDLEVGDRLALDTRVR